MPNANSYEYLEKIKIKIFENLKDTTFAPSVQIQDVPHVTLGMDEDTDDLDEVLDDLDEDENPDTRHTQRRSDQRVDVEGELSDSEDEESGYLKPKNGPLRRNESTGKDAGSLSDVEDASSSGGSPLVPSRESFEMDNAIKAMHLDDEKGASNGETEESSAKKQSASPSIMDPASTKEGIEENENKAGAEASKAVSPLEKSRSATPEKFDIEMMTDAPVEAVGNEKEPAEDITMNEEPQILER
jgi:histone deacetylase 1/2